MYRNEPDLLKISFRTLVKTYFIKDEVFISHIMISPIEENRSQYYKELGTSIQKTFINRPSFNLTASKVISFDFSPKVWMLKIMRRLQILRTIFPHWHKSEKEMAKIIRFELLNKKMGYEELKVLENIKGYRDVRYLAFNLRNSISGNTPSK
jgi:indolepyruvate ferredoxin oxidoreductase